MTNGSIVFESSKLLLVLLQEQGQARRGQRQLAGCCSLRRYFWETFDHYVHIVRAGHVIVVLWRQVITTSTLCEQRMQYMWAVCVQEEQTSSASLRARFFLRHRLQDCEPAIALIMI